MLFWLDMIPPARPAMSQRKPPSAEAPQPPVPARPCSPGRPKDLEKGQAILDCAKRLFIEHGYERVSMDQIAAGAGVSKLTVYNHYGDKDRLFAEAVRSYCEQGVPDRLFHDDPAMPLRECLMQIATRFHGFIHSPDAIAGHRMLCTPQMAASPVTDHFWSCGPERMQAGMAALLQRRAERGELALDDARRAASQFFALLKGEIHAQLLFGCECRLDEDEIRRHLEASVDMLMRAYRPGAGN